MPDKPELPRFGQMIPADKFHVSKLNVRFNEPFGQSEKDKSLVENLTRGKIVQPFKARPEGNGYGVYVGRRRFLGKVEAGAKGFIVGQDVLVENISDEQARKDSLTDNLDYLRDDMDPITRARAFQDIIDANQAGIRAVAREYGVAPATISQYLKVLELTPAMQEPIKKGLIYYKDALNLAKMKPTEFQQEKLAAAAETQGRDGYIATLGTIETGYAKRGIPAGKWIVERITFERAQEQEDYDVIAQRAEALNMEVPEYIKTAALEKAGVDKRKK
jgi:ParB/RepB/Spo0J family partition protein